MLRSIRHVASQQCTGGGAIQEGWPQQIQPTHCGQVPLSSPPLPFLSYFFLPSPLFSYPPLNPARSGNTVNFSSEVCWWGSDCKSILVCFESGLLVTILVFLVGTKCSSAQKGLQFRPHNIFWIRNGMEQMQQTGCSIL